MLRILIADDHELVRRGLKQILFENISFALIEEVANGEDLLKKIAAGQWDLVISDIAMPGINGMDALMIIKNKVPDLPVLMLSTHSNEQYASFVLRAGAAGYLSKDVAATELISAVHVLLQGKKYIPPLIAEKMGVENNLLKTKNLHETLSKREFEVFKLLAEGKSLKEIAKGLFIGITTVSTYRFRVLEKMCMRSNAELTRYAIENHLL